MTKAGCQQCKTWYNEAHREGGLAPLTRRERNSFNFWKGSEARREEEQERAEKRRTLGVLGEEAFLEFSSEPDLARLVHSCHRCHTSVPCILAPCPST